MLVAHADWSVDPRKRWLVIAAPAASGWHLRGEPAGPLPILLERLRSEAGGAPVLLGVDTPIGVPQAYAAGLAGAADGFRSFLEALRTRPLFFEVCERLEEVSQWRPFYPRSATAGLSARRHREALRIPEGGMLRRCERAQPGRRPAAAPLFWTVGAKQVGKAALVLWRELLLGPAAPALWPFDGDLAELLRTRPVVVAEAYPAEAMQQLGLRLRGSKRDREARRALAGSLLATARELQSEPVPALAAQIADGFGTDLAAEDRFDALIGLLGMLAAVRDPAGVRAPDDEAVRRWEGWIFGQDGP